MIATAALSTYTQNFQVLEDSFGELTLQKVPSDNFTFQEVETNPTLKETIQELFLNLKTDTNFQQFVQEQEFETNFSLREPFNTDEQIQLLEKYMVLVNMHSTTGAQDE